MRSVKENFLLLVMPMLKGNGSVSPLFQVFHMFQSEAVAVDTLSFNETRVFSGREIMRSVDEI